MNAAEAREIAVANKPDVKPDLEEIYESIRMAAALGEMSLTLEDRRSCALFANVEAAKALGAEGYTVRVVRSPGSFGRSVSKVEIGWHAPFPAPRVK